MSEKKLIATRHGKKFYVDGDKVYKCFDGFLKSDILNEALNQARVEETGLPVAKIHEVKVIDGQLSIVMDKIEGVTLAELMAKNPNRTDEYLNKFVDLQLSMHALKAPLLNKLRDKMERKIDSTTLDSQIKYELITRLNSMPKHTKLCHGDFNPSNVIVGNDGVDYIIDWSHATQGNASADAARTYLLFKLSGEDRLAEEYLDMFCEKSKTDKRYVVHWFPIVAASQFAKARPEEADFLLKWVDIQEFE